MVNFEDALVLEFAISLDHGVRIDDEVFRQHANARQLVASSERAGFDGVQNLLFELDVDRNCRRRIRLSEHCTRELAQ